MPPDGKERTIRLTIKTSGLHKITIADGGDMTLVAVDDRRFDPMWEACGALGLPVALRDMNPEPGDVVFLGCRSDLDDALKGGKGIDTASYASAAAGSLPHFLGVMFARTAGIELTHVPYKGTAHAMQAIAGGEISAISTVAADIGTLVRGGKARLLATSGARRAAAFPDVPTFKESGYDMEAVPWYALFAPAGTPQAAIERLSAAAIAAMRDPALKEKLEQMGLEPTGLGPGELAAILKADYDKWGPVIRASGWKPGT